MSDPAPPSGKLTLATVPRSHNLVAYSAAYEKLSPDLQKRLKSQRCAVRADRGSKLRWVIRDDGRGAIQRGSGGGRGPEAPIGGPCCQAQVKRVIGLKRLVGSTEGLTNAQAEKLLRKLMAELKPAPREPVHAMTVGEVGERYLTHLDRMQPSEQGASPDR